MGEAADELGAPTSSSKGESDDVHEIREDIEHTRAELSGTIDEIQERLAPQHLVEQAKEAALGAGSNLVEDTKAAIVDKADEYIGKAEHIVTELGYTARDTSGSMMDTIRGNPLPTAVAAAGIGWLLLRRRNSHSHLSGHRHTGWTDSDYPRANYVDRPRDGVRGQIDRAQEKAGDVVDRARGKLEDVADFANARDVADEAMDRAERLSSSAVGTGNDFWDAVRRNPVPAAMAGVGLAWLWMNRDEPRIRPLHTVSSTVEPVGGIASDIKEHVGEVADRARGQMDGLGLTAQHRAYTARTQLDRFIEDAPLAVGAAALAIGAAIGLALPTTSRERELLGEARESLVDRGQQLAQEAQERLMHVAEQVQETAKTELQHAQSDMANGRPR